MLYLEESIHSVIKLYLPCTKPPVLHVCCPKCSDTNPHIMLQQVSKISLNLPILFCNKTGKHVILPRTSYLPFGDELDDEQLPGKCVKFYMIICICTCVVRFSSLLIIMRHRFLAPIYSYNNNVYFHW